MGVILEKINESKYFYLLQNGGTFNNHMNTNKHTNIHNSTNVCFSLPYIHSNIDKGWYVIFYLLKNTKLSIRERTSLYS